MEHRLRLEAQGRSLLLFNGMRIKGRWWSDRQWESLQGRLSGELVALLAVLRDVLLAAHRQLDAATERLEAVALAQPRGVGALTSQVLEREILDWHRFQNRRQVASLTGMCPGVRASGASSRQGPITKHGNRRIRNALIELAWRWTRFQPEYRPIKKWGPVLLNPKSGGAAKKKAIVAVGRQLAVDLWRLNTERTTREKLQLK